MSLAGRRTRTRWAAGGLLLLVLLTAAAVWAFAGRRGSAPAVPGFDGEAALRDVQAQVELGPRLAGSPAHAQTVALIQTTLERSGWQVETQTTTWQGVPVTNVIGKRSGRGGPWVILGAHYDTRPIADRDPDPAKRDQPVPGANDGGSGVAVLLELARKLPEDLDPQVWLAFFDAEDGGNIDGREWSLGSAAFVAGLSGRPDAVVIADMVGDAELGIYKEQNSNPALNDAIWKVAADLGYAERFISQYRHSLIDDHTPFLTAGIPAIDIIDFDYPYWHTTQDTVDKVSAESLGAVGDVLYHWLVGQ